MRNTKKVSSAMEVCVIKPTSMEDTREIADTLLRAGIPVNTKGFIYIHDALELMDKDPYYFSGKICALYAKIAKQNGASFAQVERGIRYAFEVP